MQSTPPAHQTVRGSLAACPLRFLAMARSSAALLAGALGLLLPVLYTPTLGAGFWSGRYILIVVLAIAAVPLAWLFVVRGQLDASLALALTFVSWSAVSTLLADSPALAFWGLFGWGTGLVFVAALVSMWMIGRLGASQGADRLLASALLLSSGFSAGLAVLQTAVDLSVINLEAFEGRGHALIGNPVFLAAFLSGGLWLATGILPRRLWPGMLLTALLAAGLQASGSRAGIAVAVLVVIARCVIDRWRGAMAVPAVIAGLAIAAMLTGSGVTGTERLGATTAGSTSGLSARTGAWLAGAEAFAEAPIQGHGPSQFLSAATRHRSLEFVQAEGVLQYYTDAHNLIVEYAVTTGIVGVSLLLAWLTFAFRSGGVTTPLGGFAFAVLLLHLVEPQNVVVTPLAMLALGAASPMATARRTAPRRSPAVVLGLGAVASLALAVPLSVGIWSFNEARLDFDLAAAERADRLLPPWHQVSEQVARVYVLRSREQGDPNLEQRALAHRRKAHREDRLNPRPLLTLAEHELSLGRNEAGKTHLRLTLTLDPWAVPALNGLGAIESDAGNIDAAVRYFATSLRIEPDQPAVIARLSELRPQAAEAF